MADEHYYYAGILSGTNLGAPVSQDLPVANWQGQIGWSAPVRNNNTLPPEPMDFTLNINFADSTINGQVDLANSPAFVVSGSFTPRGLITGTTSYNNNNGTLRGLIGEQGAVAAFISDENANAGYSGGFVVCPQIPCLTDE